MKKILLFGEPMVMFVGKEEGDLSTVNNFVKRVAGAELNVALGLKRLGLAPHYVCRVGADPFGHYIHTELEQAGLGEAVIVGEAYTGFQFK